MANDLNAQERRLRFTIRQALAATMIIALAFGWYASTQRAEREMSKLTRQLSFQSTHDKWSLERAQVSTRIAKNARTAYDGILSGVDLSGAILNRVTIAGRVNSFQGTIFNHCHLQNSTLSGSFQGATFDKAKLLNAKLTGGNSSFQLSSFVNADLSGATLIGGGASFQGATFQGATLVGARIVCSGASFQAVNIDSANFQRADLSAIESESLKSCYFKTPPSYDDKTRFPSQFDPASEGWMLVP